MGTNRIIDPGIICAQQWEMSPDILTAAQLVPLLHISQSSIYGLMNVPGFPTIKVKGRKFVYKDALLQWLNSYQTGGAENDG